MKTLCTRLPLVLCCIFGNLASAEHVQYDHAELLQAGRERSLRVLKKAIARASEVDSPEVLFARIAGATVAVHTPEDACQLIDKMAAYLEKWERGDATWPESGVNAFAVFAQCVAPFSPDKRDAHLKRALRRSAQQRPKDEHLRRMSELEEDMWRAVLLSREQSVQAEGKLRGLCAKARKLGYFGSCCPRTYEMAMLEQLTRLAPALTLTVWPKEDKENLPAYCLRQACELHEHTYGGTNRFSATLLTYAIEHGKQSVDLLRLYKFYDTEGAYQCAAKFPADYLSGVFDRGWATADILGYWAWSAPEKALELAEQEKDPNVLRDAIQAVSTVWAYRRPREVERALRKQDNAVRQSWARRIASEELQRRREGKPPTESPTALCQGDSPREITRARFACTPEEREGRVATLVETIKSSQDDTLYELTCLFVYDKQLGMAMLKPNKYYSSRQSYLMRMINQMGYWGDHDLAEELLAEVEDPRAYVSSACDLAENAVKRLYVLHGDGAPRIRERTNTGNEQGANKAIDGDEE